METYLDNAATTMIAKEVIVEIDGVMLTLCGNPSSPHKFGRAASDILQKSREVIANKLGCDPSEIIFTSSGTESNNLAIRGAVKASGKNHIITSVIEHPTILNTCKDLKNDGIKVTCLKVDKFGFIKPKELESLIRKDTALVTIMHANNEIGTINDAVQIGLICRKHCVLFHTDAVQSFGKIPINIRNIDLLSISSHKIHGPKGVAALYVRNSVKLKPIITGGPQEFGMRAGTENVHAITGFAKAVELLNYGDYERLQKLKNKLIDGILKINCARLNGPREKSLPTIASFSFDNIDCTRLILKLDSKGIYCSAGSACSSNHPSYVINAIGSNPLNAIRLSLSRYTTEKEIDYVLSVLPSVLKEIR